MTTRWVSIFGSCVGFSLSSHDSHTYTQECLKGPTSPFYVLQFWIHVCLFFLPPSVCCLLFYFLYNLWNAIWAIHRRINRVHTTRWSDKWPNQQNWLWGSCHSATTGSKVFLVPIWYNCLYGVLTSPRLNGVVSSKKFGSYKYNEKNRRSEKKTGGLIRKMRNI